MLRVFRSKEAGQSNVNNINNVRCEATVHFRNKKFISERNGYRIQAKAMYIT